MKSKTKFSRDSLFVREKKGSAQNLVLYFSIFLGVLVIAYMFFIMSDSLKDTVTDTNSSAYQAMENIETGMLNATEQLPQAGKLIGIGVILGVIGLAIYGAYRQGWIGGMK